MTLLRTLLGTVILGAAGTAVGQTALEPIKSVEIGSRAELRVNGKPFFPLMLWLQAPRDFQRQKELGFNVMAGYPGERGRMDAYVAEVWKAGMYFVAALPRQIGADARKIAGTRIEVLDEGRTIAAENNRFTDAFGPLGEHVYRIPAR